jgi:heptosyltransferase-2
MSNPTPKILILSLSGIGNYIMQSPAIEALKKHWPDCHITVWVAPRGTKQLAENDPNVDAVIESPIKLSIKSHLKWSLYLTRKKFDVALMLSPGQLWKGSAYMFLAGIPKRIAHQYPFYGNPDSSFLLTDSIKEDPTLHDTDQNLSLLSCLEIENWKLKIGAPYHIAIPLENHKNAKSILQLLKISNNAPLIGIHPGCAPGFEWKRWPLENFAKLAQLLTTDGSLPLAKRKSRTFRRREGVSQPTFLIFGGPEEEEQKNNLKEMIGHVAHVISTDLLTTSAIISNCSLFVSNDSGLMHIAAATNIPTFGLFGPTDENQTGPRGSQSYVVRAKSTKPIYKTETAHNPGKSAQSSMLAITPQQVLDVITQHHRY